MCSFLVPMTSCKLAHCFLQTLPLTQIIQVGILAGCFFLKTGISLDVLFPLPSNKCFGYAPSWLVEGSACISHFLKNHKHYFIRVNLHQRCTSSQRQSRKQKRHGCSSQGVYILVWGDRQKPRKLADTIISKDNIL